MNDTIWKLALGLNFVVINAPMLPTTDSVLLLTFRHIVITIGCIYIAKGLAAIGG